MKVAILFDEISPEDVLADRDVLQQVGMVVKALKRLGHTYVLIPCTLDLQQMKDELLLQVPDVTFNLLDTLDSYDGLSYLPVAVLDALQIKHTGPRAVDLALTTRKLLIKEKLIAAGLPTPGQITLSTTESMNGTWLIKGSEEDGSFAMTDKSVIQGTTEEIKQQLQEWNTKTGRIGFAEQYVTGREFTCPFLCGKTLPVAEITYVDYPEGKPKILGQEAKWQPDSFEAKHTGSRYEFPLEDQQLIAQMLSMTQECLTLFKLKGWGRIDFRVSDDNTPYIIDVNSGSCLAEDAWFYGSLHVAGIDFDVAMKKVMDEVL